MTVERSVTATNSPAAFLGFLPKPSGAFTPFRRDLSPFTLRKNHSIDLNMPKITVILVDDHNVVRSGLKALLNGDPDFEVVGEGSSGREAVVLAQRRGHGPRDAVIERHGSHPPDHVGMPLDQGRGAECLRRRRPCRAGAGDG